MAVCVARTRVHGLESLVSPPSSTIRIDFTTGTRPNERHEYIRVYTPIPRIDNIIDNLIYSPSREGSRVVYGKFDYFSDVPYRTSVGFFSFN